MSHAAQDTTEDFLKTVDQIRDIGKDYHSAQLLERARDNQPKIGMTLADLPPVTGTKKKSAIMICAGPSLIRRDSIKKIKQSGYEGSIVAIDGSYIACLRQGLVPDYVLTLDPHPKRVVAWFGGWDANTKDDYFQRQDLDKEFRAISKDRDLENVALVNKYGPQTKAIVSTSAPPNVVARLQEAKLPTYWWNPLVDDPTAAESLTRQLHKINRIPAMNTGGNVGTAAWVFASEILQVETLAMVGMDFGYEATTPIENTQTYFELIRHNNWSKIGIEKYFLETDFPLTNEKFYTDPTFYWYRSNFLELMPQAQSQTINCTEGGTLFGANLPCMYLDAFLKEVR